MANSLRFLIYITFYQLQLPLCLTCLPYIAHTAVITVTSTGYVYGHGHNHIPSFLLHLAHDALRPAEKVALIAQGAAE